MDIQVREINSYTREMDISAPWEELQESFNVSIDRFRKKVKLQGFRKGKVPKKILLQQFLLEIEADFAQQTVEQLYIEALREKGFVPVNRAEIEAVDFSQGQPLTFTATFEVEPTVTLPKYSKKMKVNKNVYQPDEQDVDDFIEELRRQSARLETNETGSVEGSLLFVDMQELDFSGVPIIGRKVEDRYIKVGDGVFGGENLDRLTGLKVGDTAVVDVASPDGKESTRYQLTIKNVQEEIMPRVDEDFIKKVDGEAETEEAFRSNIMERIQKRLDHDAEAQFEDEIIAYFLRETDPEVPPSMIDGYIDNSFEDARNRNGETLDEEQFRTEMRPSVVRNLKWYLIRKELIRGEEVSIADERVDERIDEIVAAAGKESGQIRRFYRKQSNRERLREDLMDRELFEKIKSYAKVSEVKIATSELRKQKSLAQDRPA
ncbi:MAG: trigger factor [Candidatus Marinimicrobia bacterium]|jgi:trigger factor|nr:trigger factor [Candidatus Neomarinimicrobiota bacterium]MDP6593525.1 trigger factor [Candidatus Neomarinimicrobiota bacterium]MDP6837116.1 trigger factor [Candidatus Neomarinimicrobiota bacterium]MDP6966406.1 trigger factor [Candidatus Neomarinimicrobiota bacterium]|tara:strand:+ start:1304 stop:2602 length:1299 start_codon:yes stop_codon:yes gene_type:complete